jgi:hypothetical protein
MNPKRASKNAEAQARRGRNRHPDPAAPASARSVAVLTGWRRAGRIESGRGGGHPTRRGLCRRQRRRRVVIVSGTTGGSTASSRTPTISGENPLTGVVTGVPCTLNPYSTFAYTADVAQAETG